MSVPHLDTRVIDGQRELLFGPFAGFSTKFLKQGSYLDLPGSVKTGNLYPMIRAGLDNVGLTRYLVGQVTQSPAARVEALREFVPEARGEDWKLEIAGQRAVMAGLVQASFAAQIPQFEARMQALMPVYGKQLAKDPGAVREARARSASVLGIVQ